MSDPEQKWDDIPSLDLEMDTDYEDRAQAQERRRHPRVDVDDLKNILSTNATGFPIRIATATHGVFDGAITNLSQSGLRLTSPKNLIKGEKVKVGFKVDERTIITKAIIRWICTNEVQCTAGIEFQALSEKDEEFLKALVTANMFNKTGAFKI